MGDKRVGGKGKKIGEFEMGEESISVRDEEERS